MKKFYSGRTQRLPFALFFLGILVLVFARSYVLGEIFDIEDINSYENLSDDIKSLFLIASVLSTIFILFLFSFPVVRRFHDMNKGGENFFFMLIPLLNIFYLIRLLFEKGTTGPNKYGIDPKNPTAVYIPPEYPPQAQNTPQ